MAGMLDHCLAQLKGSNLASSLVELRVSPMAWQTEGNLAHYLAHYLVELKVLSSAQHLAPQMARKMAPQMAWHLDHCLVQMKVQNLARY